MPRQTAARLYPGLRARHFHPGFTLVEILVALVVAGLLTAMLATVLGRGLVASSALEDTVERQRTRIVLQRLLSMDLRGKIPETELTITEHGFTLETVANHLVPGPLPVTVTWDFSRRQVRRIEEQPELDYALELLMISDLQDATLAFHDLSEGRWVNARSWLLESERPAPAGLRLELLPTGARTSWEIIHRLPLEHHAPH
ncbi:PilW family protein [Desulfonatronum thioautotrophicum]|uniref:PilW family protein n=1 Tax=Desulfonatronum thioautotrophicum TaxID=617001 RepID=UPI001379255F|nr:type II secretion system protein [Desulfonatronum thioautotrophicum]